MIDRELEEQVYIAIKNVLKKYYKDKIIDTTSYGNLVRGVPTIQIRINEDGEYSDLSIMTTIVKAKTEQ